MQAVRRAAVERSDIDGDGQMTFRFSEASLSQYNTLHPDLKILATAVLEIHDFAIIEGYRNQAKQNKAVRDGKSKISYPHSRHNRSPSEAMDLMPYVSGKAIGWEDWHQWRYFGGIVIGMAHMLYRAGLMGQSIRWGHDFNSNNDLDDQRFIDAPHFELRPLGRIGNAA